jgi:hypothetical protein
LSDTLSDEIDTVHRAGTPSRKCRDPLGYDDRGGGETERMRINLCLTAAIVVLSSSAAIACQPTPETKTLERRVLAHYQAGQRTQAHEAMKSVDYAAPWAVHGKVEVQAVFDSRAKGLTLNVRRKAGVSSSGDILVSFPAGTFAKASRSDGSLPQDLLLLRAPVISLGSLHRTGSVTVPVACASFRRHGPKPGVGYSLKMATPGSNLDRLAQVLCTGSAPPPDTHLALAIWVAHEDLPYARIANSAGFRTFRTPRQKVSPTRDGAYAEKLLKRAGIDPQRTSFFRSFDLLPARAGSKRTPAPATKAPPSERKPAPKPVIRRRRAVS